MMGNIIKVLSVIVLSYIFGFIAGRILGGFFGLIASIFFREIISSNQIVLVSTLITLLSGGILGYIATDAGRKIFETSDNPILGMLLGLVIGLVVLLNHGFIQIPVPDISDQLFYRIPILHGAITGHQIGIILFPLIGIRGVIHEVAETRKRIKANEEGKNELSFYKSRKTEENK